MKAKDFDVNSQELLKQHWLFSRIDAHSMQRNHGSCTEGEGLSSGKTQLFDALQHVSFSCSFIYILLYENQGQKPPRVS